MEDLISRSEGLTAQLVDRFGPVICPGKVGASKETMADEPEVCAHANILRAFNGRLRADNHTKSEMLDFSEL